MNTKMTLRSSVTPEEKELEIKRKNLEAEEKQNRPFLSYSGKVNYATTLIDCAMACDELLKMVDQHTDGTFFVVGFDMEWPFNFQTGSGKTSLIQISPNLDICHLLHLPLLKHLPKGLIVFLEHPKVKLTGINIKNDVRKLCRDYPGVFNVDKLIGNCIDSGVMANEILPINQRWSMEKLVDYVLKMKINKNKKVRMSKWHVVPLREHQQIYAAIDGYASLLLYQELKKLQTKILQEKNGNILDTYLLRDISLEL